MVDIGKCTRSDAHSRTGGCIIKNNYQPKAVNVRKSVNIQYLEMLTM